MRKVAADQLEREMIQTSHHYVPIHKTSFYKYLTQVASPSLPVSEKYSSRELTLPLYPAMTQADVSIIVKNIKKGLK